MGSVKSTGSTPGGAGLHLVFYLDDLVYGVPVSSVREILPMVEITPVPNAPTLVRGVVNLRGTIIPVIDIRRKLKLSERLPDAHTCLVVADAPGRPFAFLADRVTDCLELEDVSLPEDAGALPPERRFIRGMGQHGGQIIVLLDLEGLLTAADRKTLKGL